jgi:hypothetical protein
LLCAPNANYLCVEKQELRSEGAGTLHILFLAHIIYWIAAGHLDRHTRRADPIKREVTSVNRIPTAAAPEKNFFSKVRDRLCCLWAFLTFIQSSAAFSVSRASSEDRSTKCAYYFIALWSHAAIFRYVASRCQNYYMRPCVFRLIIGGWHRALEFPFIIFHAAPESYFSW